MNCESCLVFSLLRLRKLTNTYVFPHRARPLSPQVRDAWAARHPQEHPNSDSEQPAGFWHRVLDDRGRANLVANIAGHLKNAKKAIRDRTLKEYFGKVDATFAARIEEAMKKASL